MAPPTVSISQVTESNDIMMDTIPKISQEWLSKWSVDSKQGTNKQLSKTEGRKKGKEWRKEGKRRERRKKGKEKEQKLKNSY